MTTSKGQVGDDEVDVKVHEDQNDSQGSGETAANDDGIDLYNANNCKGNARIDAQLRDEAIQSDESQNLRTILSIQFARIFDKEFLQVTAHLQVQTQRLKKCEERVQKAVIRRRALFEKHDEVQLKLKWLQERWQRERDERAEEREWIAKLWPDHVPLPTLLRPKTQIEFVKDLTDEKERERLKALMTKRIERERVHQLLEEASHWQVVIPQALEEGDKQLPYYINTCTGVSVWDVPVAIDFKAPDVWDMTTMDWKEDYGLEHFYPEAQRRMSQLDDEKDNTRGKTDAAQVGPTTDDEGDSDDEPLDPMPAREQFEDEKKRYESLRAQLEQSAAKQRTFAMEVLTATRELFAQEQEQLKKEDDAVIAVERRRKMAEQEEVAAAKAKADAQQRSAQKIRASGPVYTRINIVKKDVLPAVDEVLEQEFGQFALQQRLDRLYLSMPLTRDVRVRNRHRLEPEFVHMKHVEARVLESEHLESTLLEKSAIRLDEAAAKATEGRHLCHDIRKQQLNAHKELERVETLIATLQAAVPLPKARRPSEQELEQAARRELTVTTLSGDDNDVEYNGNLKDFLDHDVLIESAFEEDATTLLTETATGASSIADHNLDDTSIVNMDVNAALMAKDETELRKLKAFTDAEIAWRRWEKSEQTRCSTLLELKHQHTLLTASLKQLVVDLVRLEEDTIFFEQLRDSEKAAHTRLWDLQAQTQVERARFLVERTAREESVFQLQDRLQELQQRLEDAYALPVQAIGPLERIKLQNQSENQVALLEKQKIKLQATCAKEEKAKALLMAFELQSCDYVDKRLQEEYLLADERQRLWDLHLTLMNEIQACWDTKDQRHLSAEPNGTKEIDCLDDRGQEASSKQLLKESVHVFETKLQYLKQVRGFLLMCYDREDRWRALLTNPPTLEDWMPDWQLSRQEKSLALLRTQREEQEQFLQNRIDSLTQTKVSLQAKVDKLDGKIFRLQSEYQAASESVRLQTLDVITALRKETEEHKNALENEKQTFRVEREQLICTHNALREELETRLQELEDVNERQTHWLTAVKRELKAQRIGNEQLLKAFECLEQRRAAEVNDMHFCISSQSKTIHNLYMWNLSLKKTVKDAQKDYVTLQQDIERDQQRHKELQRGLRLINWRHRVTAQSILTDVNLLFSFFAHGIEILAGATVDSNDALRENAGIEVLAALAQYSKQQTIRAICARALGLVSWNANASMRSLGWKAKVVWFQWIKIQSEAVLNKISKTPFDAVADEESTDLNWLADPSAPTENLSGESDNDFSSKGGRDKMKKIKFIKTWQHFDDLVIPNMNVTNQQHIGLSSTILQSILELCKAPETDQQVKCNALHSLALIARSSSNTSIIGSLDGSISLLTGLLKSDFKDSQMVRHASQALANLAFQNTFNQQIIVAEGGISFFLCICEQALSSFDGLQADVDLILASTQVLSHLSHDHILSCQVIVESRGIPILTKLCNSSRIFDAIDLEVGELIQTYASQVVANVITLLDDERNESDQRSFNVADFILQKEEATTLNDYHGVRTREYDTQEIRQTPKYAGVATFVLMCASCNRNVAFHGAVVLGSIAQHDAIRGAIGAASGIDALFLLTARSHDLAIVTQATWALANLTWHRDNQYRVARYIDQLYQLCTFKDDRTAKEALKDPMAPVNHEDLSIQIQQHALCVLANSLFYNEANRQLIASRLDWMQLLCRNAFKSDGLLLENSARALCSLSYSDATALQMGSAIFIDPLNGKLVNGLDIFFQLCGRTGFVTAQQHGLFGVINMCLHDENKTKMLENPYGIDTLVSLSGHMNKELCDPALEALDLLADLRQYEQDQTKSLFQTYKSFELDKLIALLSNARNPSLVGMISDAIADKVWVQPKAPIQLPNLEKLLAICTRPSPLSLTILPEALSCDSEKRVRVSCLWALRNTVANNVRNQDFVGALNGIQQLVSICDQIRQSEEVVEALLAALVSLVTQHARNSQHLVQFGVEMLINLADTAEDSEEQRTLGRGVVLPSLMSSSRFNKSIQNSAGKQLENAALARELLFLIAPYNIREDAPKVLLLPNTKSRKMHQLQSSSTSPSPVHKRNKTTS